MSVTANVTSVVGAAPEVSAPIRLEGQANSEVLFNWLAVRHRLWMLQEPHFETFELLVGTWGAIKVGQRLIKWKKQRGDGHPALRVPHDEADIKAAFETLDRLLKAHFFGK